jgi:hypothetical protein
MLQRTALVHRQPIRRGQHPEAAPTFVGALTTTHPTVQPRAPGAGCNVKAFSTPRALALGWAVRALLFKGHVEVVAKGCHSLVFAAMCVEARHGADLPECSATASSVDLHVMKSLSGRRQPRQSAQPRTRPPRTPHPAPRITSRGDSLKAGDVDHPTTNYVTWRFAKEVGRTVLRRGETRRNDIFTPRQARSLSGARRRTWQRNPPRGTNSDNEHTIFAGRRHISEAVQQTRSIASAEMTPGSAQQLDRVTTNSSR